MTRADLHDERRATPMRRLRILFLTSTFPYPLTSGYLRVFHFMRELAVHHDVSLLSLVTEGFEPEHAAAVASMTKSVRTFPGPRGLAAKWVHEDVRPVLGLDRSLWDLRNAALAMRARREVDVAVVCGKRLVPVAEALRRVPVVVDLCDTESIRLCDRVRYAAPRDRPRLWIARAFVRAMECRTLRCADHVLVASLRDRDGLPPGTNGRVSVLPNGVDADYWRRMSPAREESTILFTGAMDYRPNEDAALQIAHTILPKVRRVLPEARALLVGRDPSEELLRAGQAPGVTVTGSVEDVRPFLEAATVFAAPLRFASGIQNKLLEAMAMEVPAVASPAAADGLVTEAGERPPLRVARSEHEFAEQLIGVLRDGGGRDPDSRAREYVVRNFSWRRHAETLERVLLRVVAARKVA